MNKYIKTMLILFILLTAFSLTANAEERVGFSVQAELPENQINKTVSYFDLLVEPNQEQELNITIFNHENEDIIVHGDIFNATTNSSGVIVYKESEIDSSLTYPVTELASLEGNEWKIKAGESIIVKASLHIPDESFDGIKLGGIYFEKALNTEEESEEGINIHNKYAYTIGLQLSENDREVSPDLVLGSVVPELVNYRTAIIANIQNKTPAIMENLSVKAEVFTDDETPLRVVEQQEIRMAPNSTMPFVINWENQLIEAGNYLLKMTANDGEQEWEWQEEFQINETDESLNEEAVELEQAEETGVINNIYIIGLIIALVIIFILLFYIRKIKNKEDNDK